MKPRIAIYDFTDCEGCEVKLLSIKKKLLDLEERFDIVNWRLGQEKFSDGPYDITIIEGTPVTQDEIALLRELRERSGAIVALGACASVAGIPGIMNKDERAKWYKKIYGENYKPKGIDALPLSSYVKVDHMIHGCPIEGDELLRTLEDLLAKKTPKYRGYSVCFDCKKAGNKCRILEEKICFGPITQGGCKAICISGGSPCYGCFGIREEANVEALVKRLKGFASDEEIMRHAEMFFNQIPEYKNKIKEALK